MRLVRVKAVRSNVLFVILVLLQVRNALNFRLIRVLGAAIDLLEYTLLLLLRESVENVD